MEKTIGSTMLLCAAAAFFSVKPSHATEYSLDVYFADADVVLEAIGSKNPALEELMLSDRAYVEDKGLELRFTDKEMWKRAVSDIVAGEPRENIDINGYALTLLLRQVGESVENGTIGLPFADLRTVSQYFVYANEPILAQFFGNIDYWIKPADEGMQAVWQAVGPTEYHARVSMIAHEDAAIYLKTLDRFQPHLKGIRDYQYGEDTPEAALFEQGVRYASTAKWMDYARQNPPDDETQQEFVKRMVTSALKDPYEYYQEIQSVGFELDRIGDWLRRAQATKKDIFAVYYSY